MTDHPIHIPTRFRQAVVVHLVCNKFSTAIGNYPLILAVHGPPGSGKTFQCEHILNALGIRAFLISAADMEHESAGVPAKLLRQAYIEASNCIDQGQYNAAALLMNDIDAGLGDWGLQGTMNRQLLFGELMRFTDNPNEVDDIGTHRIPIIVTANDLTKLYYPLLRPGRSTLFEWIPTSEEKRIIVRSILPEVTERVADTLVHLFPEASIGFFVELRASLFDDLVAQITNPLPLGEVFPWILQNLRHGDIRFTASLDEMIARAKELQGRHLNNHLLSVGSVADERK